MEPAHSDHRSGIAFRDFELAEEVEAAVCRRLHHGGPAHLQVQACYRGVVLRGYVHSYYQKQVALHEALSLAGAGCVRDEVEVV